MSLRDLGRSGDRPGSYRKGQFKDRPRHQMDRVKRLYGHRRAIDLPARLARTPLPLQSVAGEPHPGIPPGSVTRSPLSQSVFELVLFSLAGALLGFELGTASALPARGRGTSSSPGSQVGPHFSTRFAIRHHSATWLSLALIQFTGTGASRRFSPSLAKQSHPALYSEATAPRLPRLERRSPSTLCSIRCTAFSIGERRSILRLSIEEGCTIQTSQTFPRRSRKVR